MFMNNIDYEELSDEEFHKMFEEFNYQNNTTARRKKDNWQEWFNVKFENLLPFLLEIATDFEIRDEDYCTKICKTIKENDDFYKILIKREPSKYQKLHQEIKDNYGYCPLLDNIDFKQEKESKKVETKAIEQKQQSNKVCKYETEFDSIGRAKINWNLFFEDHKELVGKSVYPYGKPNVIGTIKKITQQKQEFGILFNGKDIMFADFVAHNIRGGLPTYNYICFKNTNKTIKQTYEELKWK